MGNTSEDIEALLVDVNDPGNLAPKQLPAIFCDIVGRLNVQGISYAVAGRIALALHEQTRFVRDIEIVAELGNNGADKAASLMRETHERFAPFTDRRKSPDAIGLSLRSCSSLTEGQLLIEATPCTWFGIEARLASSEHLLWLWCRSDLLDHRADAIALIQAAPVDLQRVRQLLREADDAEEGAQMCLRLAIGDAVLASESSFSHYMEERHARLKPGRVPVWRLRDSTNPNDVGK